MTIDNHPTRKGAKTYTNNSCLSKPHTWLLAQTTGVWWPGLLPEKFRGIGLSIRPLTLISQRGEIHGNCHEHDLIQHTQQNTGGRGYSLIWAIMCDPKGYGFIAAVVINRVSILVILASNEVWFLHCCPEFEFTIIDNAINKSLSQCL